MMFIINIDTFKKMAAYILLQRGISPKELNDSTLSLIEDVTLLGDGNVFYKGKKYTATQLNSESVLGAVSVFAENYGFIERINYIIKEVSDNLNCVIMEERDADFHFPDVVEANNNCELSILIPTYNRSTVLKSCLDKLLQLNRQDVEFLVSDDCSIDDTAFIMQQYNDPRISFYRNNRNGGASYNSHLCFLRAKGKYALLISDEDDLLLDKLEILIEQLKKSNDISVYIAGGIRGKNDIKCFPSKEYTDGYSALRALGYKTRYMTGIIFNVELYQNVIGAVSYRNAPDIFNVYSFMYAMAKLFFCGRVITSDMMLFEETRFSTTTITNNIKSHPDIFYFEPSGRQSQIECGVKNLMELPLTKEQQLFMLFKIYYETVKVAIRIFDEKQLKRYQQLIPDYYTIFLDHISGFSKEKVVCMLYEKLMESIGREGICTQREFECAISENEEVREFLKGEQVNARDYFPLFS